MTVKGTPSDETPTTPAAQMADLLAALQELPPTDQVWCEVGGWLEDLEALRQEKEAARRELEEQSRVWEQAAELTRACFVGHADLIRFLELPTTDAWPPALPAGLDSVACQQLTRSLEHLIQLLDAYEVSKGTAPATKSERARLLREQEAQEADIRSVYSSVVAGIVTQTPPPEGRGETESAAESPPRPDQQAEGEAQAPPALIPEPQMAAEEQPPPTVPAQAEDRQDDISRRMVPGQLPYNPPAPVKPASQPEGPSLPLSELQVTVANAVAARRFADAYWLSFGQQEVAGGRMIPPWILKACFLAPHVQVLGDEASSQVSELLFEHPDPLAELTAVPCTLTRQEAQLLTLLAVARPALCMPALGAVAWIENVGVMGMGLQALVQAIVTLSSTGVALDSAAAHRSHQAKGGERAMRELAGKADDWLQRQRVSRFAFGPATKVIHRMASDQIAVGAAARVVAENRREALARVRQVLGAELADRRSMLSDIALQTEVVRAGPTTPTITGPILDSLVTRLEELRDILRDWAENAEAPESDPGDWRLRQVDSFKHTFQEAWEALRGGSGNLAETPLAERLAAAVWDQMKELEDVLLLAGNQTDTGPSPAGHWLRELRRPLLLLDGSDLIDDRSVPAALAVEKALELAGRLAAGGEMRLAVGKHVAAGDFLAAELALAELEGSADWPAVRKDMQDRLAAQAEAFRQRCNGLKANLEQATIDHVLADAERSEMEGHLLSLEARADVPAPRFGPLYAEAERLAGQLQTQRQQRLTSLSTIVTDLSSTVDAVEEPVRSWAAAFHRQAEQAVQRGDLALADEYVASAETVLRTRQPLEPAEDRQPIEDFERFSRVLPDLIKLLEDSAAEKRIRTALAAGKSVKDILPMGEIPGARHREIGLALDAFAKLKEAYPAPGPHGRYSLNLMAILGYVGFRSPEVEHRSAKRQYWHFSVKMSDAGLSPLPQFGSFRGGRYDVVVIWERPNAETIGQMLQEAGAVARCPVILFMGRLPQRQREEWNMYCRRNQITAMLVDEALMFYLATVRAHRLPACIGCALPWGFASPYTPFGAGNVPPEMFRGRQTILRELCDPLGPTFIYGGRQLGKSAILRSIERSFHDPDKRQYAFLDDIRLLGDPDSGHTTGEIWRRLRDWAAGQKLLNSRVPDTPQVVAQELKKAMDQEPDRRLLILLDEADKFLAADFRSAFDELQRLKRLMDDTGRRLKVVFSGLHGVQRYHSMPNHPFAHLQAINLGPLEPKDARALIREPMEYLGFRFPDDNAIYRILAYTNYQPALIQHFCSELIKARRNSAPPYPVTLRMVDDVYRLEEVRKVMRERFEWTIGLDPLYEVLVYTMIVEQSAERDGYRRQFTAREALDCARQWWDEGFRELGPDDGKSLLDELVGLGVLVRLGTGAYRLRNANVVRALGSEKEIENRLEDLISRGAPQTSDSRVMRALVGDQAIQVSPLTLEQESTITKSGGGLHMIFASPALGGEHLPNAILRLVPPDVATGQPDLLTLPPDCLSVRLLEGFLNTRVFERASGRVGVRLEAGQLFAFAEPIDEVVDCLLGLLAKRRASRRPVHCILTFAPDDTVRWCQRPVAAWRFDEDRASSVAHASPWRQEVVRRYLHTSGMMSNEAVAREVWEALGGWPWLAGELQALLAEAHPRGLEGVDPRPVAKELRRRLGDATEMLATQFLAAAGLDAVPFGKGLLRVIGGLETVDITELPPDLVDTTATEAQVSAGVEALARLGLLIARGTSLSVNITAARALRLP